MPREARQPPHRRRNQAMAVIGLSSQIDRMRIASIDLEEEIMDLKPGDVVILKSGGHPITVVEVNDGAIACLWMGAEGDLFRETLPLAVLELAEIDDSDEEGEEDEVDEDEAEESNAA
jgi:uncharacterized protein YodC (DUF2158 family)